MANIKKQLENIFDECTRLYSEGGVTAVTDFVNQQERLNPIFVENVRYHHCTPCENDMPVLNNTCLVCGSPVKTKTLGIGDTLRTIGDVRELIKDLSDDDIVILEACDEDGEVEDLYPMYIDVIDGIEHRDGIEINKTKTVSEVRFCQRPNHEPDTREKQPVIDTYIERLYEDTNETKSVWVCPDCGSDNVQFKTWTNANTMKASNEECPMEDGDCACLDCESTSILELVTMMPRKKLIGFQVYAIDGIGHRKLHPHTNTNSSIYNLDQAKSMMDDDNLGTEYCELKAIWTDDIECPEIMFEGNVR